MQEGRSFSVLYRSHFRFVRHLQTDPKIYGCGLGSKQPMQRTPVQLKRGLLPGAKNLGKIVSSGTDSKESPNQQIK